MTKREEHLWEELQDWYQSFYNYEASDFENTYDQWVNKAFSLLPEQLQEQFFEKVDEWLYQLNSLLRNSSLQKEASERILQTARSMNEDISTITDLRKLPIDQLTYLAEQQAAKHRLYSLLHGGMVGSGQKLALTSDFIGMLVINLRVVQLIAMSFGNPVQTPVGMRETIKVFLISTLPDRMKRYGWDNLMEDLEKSDQQFYLDAPERLTGLGSIDEPLKHLIKSLLILTWSNRKKSDLPLLSMAIGAGMNYQTTRKVTHFAMKYYQFKYLYKKYQS